jgi:hypothetical protein
MASRASLLFHTIVVVGASVGCGGLAVKETAAGDAGDPRSARDAEDAGGGSRDARDAGDAADPSESAARAMAPVTPCDCARPGTFRCSACASGAPPIEGRCPADDGVACYCDESIRIGAPSDCPYPEQFACRIEPGLDASTAPGVLYSPDWFAFADCFCDKARPILASQCTCQRCMLGCLHGACPPGSAGGSSLSAAVDFACACVPTPVPIQ